MSKSITQDMAYRQSLMKYAEKYGVSRASRKYNKGRSYIYFWRARWDGSAASLACQSRRPHSHPNQHTEAELKLIRDMRRRDPQLGLVELWHRLKQRGYTRRPESLFRVMRKLGMFPQEKKKKELENKYKEYKENLLKLEQWTSFIVDESDNEVIKINMSEMRDLSNQSTLNIPNKELAYA